MLNRDILEGMVKEHTRNRFGGGGLRKLGGISKSNAVLNTLFAGIEFAGRKGEGQTNLQTTAGTAGSTLGGIGGFAAGAKGGASIGSQVLVLCLVVLVRFLVLP